MITKMQKATIAVLCLVAFVVAFTYVGCGGSTSSSGSSGTVVYATTSTASLTVAGYQHNAKVLNNGKVFVTYGIGGKTGSIYDPATNLFTATTGTAAVTRTYTSGITKLADGRIYLCGFGNGDGTIDPPEIFDPATGLYSGTAVLPITKCCITPVLLPSGDLFVSGGDLGNIGQDMVYSPTTNAYTLTATLDPGKGRKAATYLTVLYLSNGKVFVMGGLPLPNNNVIALYNPGSDTHALPASPPYIQRSYGASGTVLQDGKVLIAGGQDSTSAYLASAELYNPISDTFSLTTGQMKTARTKHRATLLQNGKILISGGSNATGALDTLELYDPVSKTFSNAGIMRTTRVDHCAVLMNDGRVLIMGGKDKNGTKLSSCEIYTP